jgi:glycosyltransferase involved in cell wall biosynthesis
MLFFALDGIASFSIVPLRVITFIGFIIFILSFMIILWILFEKFFLGTTIQGWSSVMISIYFMGGIQVMSIGIIGEYIGRVFQQSKGRPRYIIEREI